MLQKDWLYLLCKAGDGQLLWKQHRCSYAKLDNLGSAVVTAAAATHLSQTNNPEGLSHNPAFTSVCGEPACFPYTSPGLLLLAGAGNYMLSGPSLHTHTSAAASFAIPGTPRAFNIPDVEHPEEDGADPRTRQTVLQQHVEFFDYVSNRHVN